jgi:hypothetical protein
MTNSVAGNNAAVVPKSVEGDKTFLLTVLQGLEKAVRSTNIETSATGKGIPKRRTFTRMANGLAMTRVEAILATMSIVHMNTVVSKADLAEGMYGV